MSYSGFVNVQTELFTGRLLILFVCVFVLSFLPLLALFALLKNPDIKPHVFLILEFCPSVVSVLAALPFLLLLPGNPAGDIAAGFVINFLMYISVRLVFKSHPGTVRIDFPGRHSSLIDEFI